MSYNINEINTSRSFTQCRDHRTTYCSRSSIKLELFSFNIGETKRTKKLMPKSGQKSSNNFKISVMINFFKRVRKFFFGLFRKAWFLTKFYTKFYKDRFVSITSVNGKILGKGPIFHRIPSLFKKSQVLLLQKEYVKEIPKAWKKMTEPKFEPFTSWVPKHCAASYLYYTSHQQFCSATHEVWVLGDISEKKGNSILYLNIFSQKVFYTDIVKTKKLKPLA